MTSCGGAPSDETLERTRSALADDQGCSPADAKFPDDGPYGVTVSGALTGWESLFDGYGRFDLSRVLEPAIDYANEGSLVSEVIAHQ
jgi:gamma-glutamyltranspeptidase/glutathione hydrolase